MVCTCARGSDPGLSSLHTYTTPSPTDWDQGTAIAQSRALRHSGLLSTVLRGTGGTCWSCWVSDCTPSPALPWGSSTGGPAFCSELAALPLCLNTHWLRGLHAYLARPGVAAEGATGISHPPMLVEGIFSPLSKSVGRRLHLYPAQQPRRDAALPAEEPANPASLRAAFPP